MKQAILDSSCLRSKKLFPSNTNTNFTVQLPQRMEFQRDSTICLKSIHMPNEFKRGCSIKVVVTLAGDFIMKEIDLDESISTVEELVEAINDKMGGIAYFTIVDDGLITVEVGDEINGSKKTVWLEMSRNLKKIF